MLPREFRINKESDMDHFFGAAFKKARGFSSSSKLLIIKVLPSALKNSRFGFVVSTKVDNRASVRNKVKRQLRAIAKIALAHVAQPVDVLILATPGCKKTTYDALKADMAFLLGRMRVLK